MLTSGLRVGVPTGTNTLTYTCPNTGRVNQLHGNDVCPLSVHSHERIQRMLTGGKSEGREESEWQPGVTAQTYPVISALGQHGPFISGAFPLALNIH